MYMGGRPRLGDIKTPEDRVRWANSKTMVFGAVERGGEARATVSPSRKGRTLTGQVEAHVMPGSTIYTDQSRAYNNLSRRGWEHHTIDHSAKIYVSGDVHTQTIEGFWSLVKRGISGTHHAVSPKWLQGYLNEYVWRYNRRHSGRAMFLALLLRAAVPTTA